MIFSAIGHSFMLAEATKKVGENCNPPHKNAILEIALREQQDFVDKIFLIESSITHKGVT